VCKHDLDTSGLLRMVAFWLLSGCFLVVFWLRSGLLLFAVAVSYLFAPPNALGCGIFGGIRFLCFLWNMCWDISQAAGCFLLAFWLLSGCFLIVGPLLWLLCPYECSLLVVSWSLSDCCLVASSLLRLL
jgi:hypothetical protein